MGLVAPLFLLGLAALALPFWLHRREVPSADRRAFASTRFMEASPRRMRVEKRLQYWLLLALRCALLAAIALAFARPFFTAAPSAAAAATRLHVIALDTSLSMRRGNAFDAARREALRVVGTLPSNEAVVVARIDASGVAIEAEPLTRTRLIAWLNAQQVGPWRLAYADLAAATGAFAAEFPDTPVTLHLFSDLQQNAVPPRFADLVPREAPTAGAVSSSSTWQQRSPRRCTQRQRRPCC